MKDVLQKPDLFGAAASFLCLIHCLATPFIFIAQCCASGGCASSPIWWKGIDYIFLLISFFAVQRASKLTSSSFMKPALWLSWSLLCIVLILDTTNWLSVPGFIVYGSAIVLVGLHLYNLKYCTCNKGKCCSSH